MSIEGHNAMVSRGWTRCLWPSVAVVSGLWGAVFALPGVAGDLPPPPPTPEEEPDIGPTGPRTPYPVNDPGIGEPGGPGSEPDIFPGTPTDPGTRM